MEKPENTRRGRSQRSPGALTLTIRSFREALINRQYLFYAFIGINTLTGSIYRD